MSEWVVTVPIVGRMSVFVTADDESGAREKALSGEWDGHEIIETEIVEQCRGNVCHLRSGIEVDPNE